MDLELRPASAATVSLLRHRNAHALEDASPHLTAADGDSVRCPWCLARCVGAVERMDAETLIRECNDAELRQEREAEAAIVREKTAALRSQLASIQQETEKVAREAVFHRNNYPSPTVDRSEYFQKKDALEADLAALYAQLSGQIRESEQRIHRLKDEVAEILKDDLDEKIKEIREKHAKSRENYENSIRDADEALVKNAIVYKRKIHEAEQSKLHKLQAKVENDMCAKYHSVQSKHARVRAELDYQAQRLILLQNDNAHVKKQAGIITAACKRERATQHNLARAVLFHQRK